MQNKLHYRLAVFAQMTMHPEEEDNKSKYQKWLQKKGTLLEEIELYERQVEQIKKKRKETPKHITWAELEQKDKFQRLLPGRKRLIDCIRMIAYRAETAMVRELISPTVNSAIARSLLQDLFTTEADILPDPQKKLLIICVHGASRPAANRSLSQLFANLNKTEIKYPGTDLRLVYTLRSALGTAGMVASHLPGDQVS